MQVKNCLVIKWLEDKEREDKQLKNKQLNSSE